MSFERPIALLALVLIPLVIGLDYARERRRGRFSARWASPALLPNGIDRAPGKLRYLPALFGSTHERHAPVHAESQHTPPAQKPLAHWVADVHAFASGALQAS